ncbi:hypothetical protein PVK06_020295 [Gossypium arboreum]|uniref:Uncharacterized protein n=1 Tax=Gossypium arboreum TaxID=29729 RepID=A0ABR0PLZ4_GOSAR|nr:hypothetical protein PVK06_020295 [Gossypium arboreum]
MGKGGASDNVMARVPIEIERIASTLKFKRHRVSAVRDFLPGCGRVAAPNFGLDRRNAEKPEIWRMMPHRRIMPYRRMIAREVN